MDVKVASMRNAVWKVKSAWDISRMQLISIPECPICGEMPYSTEQCHWCGQRFVQDEEIEEYAKPLTENGKCISCGSDVVIHISKYNGHKRFHCDKCGCSVIQ